MSLAAGYEYTGIIRAVENLGLLVTQPSESQTAGGVHASTSLHYQGRAVDFGVSSQGGSNNLFAIYNALLPLARGAGKPIVEMFWDPSGSGWKNGSDIGPIGGHSDHLHIGVAARVDLAAELARLNGGDYTTPTTPRAGGPGGDDPAATNGAGGWSEWYSSKWDENMEWASDGATGWSGGDNDFGDDYNFVFMKAFGAAPTKYDGGALGSQTGPNSHAEDFRSATGNADSDGAVYFRSSFNTHGIGDGGIDDDLTRKTSIMMGTMPWERDGYRAVCRREQELRLINMAHQMSFMPDYPNNFEDAYAAGARPTQIPGTEPMWGTLTLEEFLDNSGGQDGTGYPGANNPFFQYESALGHTRDAYVDINPFFAGIGGVPVNHTLHYIVKYLPGRDVNDERWVSTSEGVDLARIELQIVSGDEDDRGWWYREIVMRVSSMDGSISDEAGNFVINSISNHPIQLPTSGGQRAGIQIPVALDDILVDSRVAFTMVYDRVTSASGATNPPFGGGGVYFLGAGEPIGSPFFPPGATLGTPILGPFMLCEMQMDVHLIYRYTPPRWRYWTGDPCGPRRRGALADHNRAIQPANFETCINGGATATATPATGG